jgi:hypothetical protein
MRFLKIQRYLGGKAGFVPGVMLAFPWSKLLWKAAMGELLVSQEMCP